jgi:hypothetical protein
MNNGDSVKKLAAGLLALGLIGLFSAREVPLGRARNVVPNAKPTPKPTPTPTPSPTPTPPPTGFDNERVWGSYDDWEPAVAADPSSAYVYQLTTRYNGPSPCTGCKAPWIIFRRSADGGATWSADQFLSKAKKTHNDPQIEVGSDGAIYAVWLHEYVPGVKFTKSVDHGVSWSTPIAIAAGGQPSFSDKPILAISQDGRHVYIAFNASNSWVVASHDYGTSFSAPQQITSDTRYWFHSGGAVAPNGDVYFAATDYSQDYTGDAHVNVQRSIDFGATWSTVQVGTSKQAPACAWAAGCYLGFFGPTIGLAVDASGKLAVAYNAGPTASGPEKLYFRTSGDRGVTWSAAQEIGSTAAGVNHAFANVAAGPGSDDFRVTWQDDRNGAQTAFNTWYRRTTNAGASWGTALRLSNLTSGATYKNANGYKFPYGDYFEMAIDASGRNHVIWGEGTSYTGPGGVWYTRGQ